jgi:hypothetical protein
LTRRVKNETLFQLLAEREKLPDAAGRPGLDSEGSAVRLLRPLPLLTFVRAGAARTPALLGLLPISPFPDC